MAKAFGIEKLILKQSRMVCHLVSNQQSTNIQSRLRATYAAEGNKTILKVELTLRLDDAPDQLPKSVKQQYVLSGSVIRDKDIVVWPNFVSRRWKRYFMYSEIPGLRRTRPVWLRRTSAPCISTN